ncbi:MAG: InlB B-repeat-containing protein [Bacillus subtilis]|nr:InlB B-repeat-containing protein [Bacillus subtilis]
MPTPSPRCRRRTSRCTRSGRSTTYTITFNSNGGSAVGSITHNYATAVSAPADPTKTGYTFAGWYSDAGLTSAYAFTTMPGQNITLYTKWTINELHDQLRHQRWISGRIDHAELCDGGQCAGGSDEDWLHLRGLVFGCGSHLGVYVHHDAGTEHHAVRQVDDQQPHDCDRFNANGGSAITSITQNYATAVSAPADPTKTGYTFAGWYSDAGLTNAYTFTTMPAENITLYAKWTISSYAIGFNVNGGSAVGSITQNYGTAVTQPADPANGVIRSPDGIRIPD